MPLYFLFHEEIFVEHIAAKKIIVKSLFRSESRRFGKKDLTKSHPDPQHCQEP
jgi:hypothetical protein